MSTWRSGCPQGTLASVLGGDREQLGLVSVVTGGTGQGGSMSSWRPLSPHELPGWMGWKQEAGSRLFLLCLETKHSLLSGLLAVAI